jgi:hypothetical protein
MPTLTNPKDWKQESRMLEAVPPAHLPRNRRPAFIIPKNKRFSIVRDYLPNLSKTDKDKASEGIEAAVRKFLIAANLDGRPLPANVRVRMENLGKAATILLQELQDCDDLTREVITQKADATPPPSPKPKPRSGKRNLSDDLHTDLELDPMDPPDRIVDQLGQYAVMFAKLAKNAGTQPNSRKKTAFPTLVRELLSVWNTALGQSSKDKLAFTALVQAVTETGAVRNISPLAGDQRRKIQREINKIWN